MTAEEEAAAAKKLGWVDEKEAEKRIGTGWWEEQKNKANQPETEPETDSTKGTLASRVQAGRKMSRNEAPEGKAFYLF